MAFCGNCGQQNPDGAKFCSACGSPITNSERPAHQEGERPRQARMVYDRPLHHRPSGDRPRRRRPKKKEIAGFDVQKLKKWGICAVVVALLIWGVGSCLGSCFGSGGKQTASSYERIYSDELLAEVVEENDFPETSDNVAPLEGRTYQAQVGGFYIRMEFLPGENNGNSKVVGKVKMRVYGSRAEKYYCYCGGSVFAIYENLEGVGNKAPQHIFVDSDAETFIMADPQSGNSSFKLEEEK